MLSDSHSLPSYIKTEAESAGRVKVVHIFYIVYVLGDSVFRVGMFD